MCCSRLAVNTGRKMTQKSLSEQHRTTLSSYIFATKARMDNPKNSNISSTYPYNTANFGPLTAEIGCSGVWGIPANFNGFRVLASLLERRRSPEANQTIHDVWPSPWLVHYVYIFGGCCPNGILPGVQVLHSPI